MTRATELRLIREHIETALWLADGLPTTPGQMHLRDTLIGAMQEICVLFPAAEARTDAARPRGL